MNVLIDIKDNAMAHIMRVLCMAIIIIVEMICADESSAQYINAYQSGTVWEFDGLSDADPGVRLASRCFFDGEISSGDQSYMMMYKESWDVANPAAHSKSYQGAVRFEDGRVYYLPAGYCKEFLIFAFNIKEGDEIIVYPGIWGYYDGAVPNAVTVECVSEAVESDYASEYSVLRVKELVEGYDPGINEWIKGIGSKAGPLDNLYSLSGGGSLSLCKVTLNGQVIYDVGSSEVRDLKPEESECLPGNCYNLDGTVNKDSRKGICITSDGKKIVK